MNNAIEVTCMLSDSQLTRLKNVTEQIKAHSKNDSWDNQMTLQLAIGNTHLTEMVLVMLEGYIADNIK